MLMMNIDANRFGLLKICGPDGFKLLQGQLTCDVKQAVATQCLLAAHCNAKGRVLWLGYLFHYQDAYYIHLPQNMVALAIAALKKYALFYKVKLEDVTASYICVGSKEALKILPHFFKTPDGRYLYICNANETLQVSSQPMINWHTSNIERGIPTIYPQTSEKYLPHELNLHQIQAISFDKGCYTGQEIIARMHYRGKMKKQLFQATLVCDSEPLPGDDILKMLNPNNSKVCGSIVDVAASSQNTSYHVLLILDHEDVTTTPLYLANNPTVAFRLRINEHE